MAEGGLSAGLSRPVVLASGPSGSLADLQVTLSAPDVGYVVWEQQPSTQLRLSVVCNGEIAVSDRPLLRDAVPLALFPLAGGRAALVFDRYGHGTPFLQYGLLSASGRIGTTATIAHPGTHDTAATELSVNARGELIASWVHNDTAAPPGTRPASPRFVAARLIVSVCEPALRCAAPQTVPLGATKPACINPTVAISPSGTTTVIAAATGWGVTGCDRPLGMWASVTPGSSTRLRPMRLLRRSGDFPVAEPVNNGGTAMVFNPGPGSSDSFAWSFLPTNGGGRPRTTRLDRGGWRDTGQQTLAPAINGWYLITWAHANSNSNPQVSDRAALGHTDRLGPSLVAVSSGRHTAGYVGATDGRGDAIILFNGSTDTGDGAPWPYTSGLYTTVLRR